MPVEIPSAILDRLHKDEVESLRYLEGSTGPATQAVKEVAEKKLLSITGKAIDTLEEVMDYGQPKDRIAAASKVLDSSPATRATSNQQAEAILPPEALKVLMEGMGKMLSFALDHVPSEIKRAESLEEPKVAPKRRKHAQNQ